MLKLCFRYFCFVIPSFLFNNYRHASNQNAGASWPSAPTRSRICMAWWASSRVWDVPCLCGSRCLSSTVTLKMTGRTLKRNWCGWKLLQLVRRKQKKQWSQSCKVRFGNNLTVLLFSLLTTGYTVILVYLIGRKMSGKYLKSYLLSYLVTISWPKFWILHFAPEKALSGDEISV